MACLHAPGWPVVLYDQASGVLLRPYRRSDAAAWSRSRIANRQWLAPWEPTAPPRHLGGAELAGRRSG